VPAKEDLGLRTKYESELVAVHGALLDPEVHNATVRLLWLRPFEGAVAISIQKAGERFELTFKQTPATGGTEPQRADIEKKLSIDSIAWRSLIASFERAAFWDLPSEEPVSDSIVLGRSAWVIERLEGNRYHIVDRESVLTDMHSIQALQLGSVVQLMFDLAEVRLRHGEPIN
jgi:hypothetical protein